MYGIIAGSCVIFASILGSILGLLFKNVSHKVNDMILGFASGVMLTAAFVGLLPTAFGNTAPTYLIMGVVGVLLGAILISLIDKFIPHIHLHGDETVKDRSSHRILLLVIAIAIHNIPEGLATGIVFGNGVTQNALTVALAMVIQKLPEGLIVSAPLIAMGIKRPKTFAISLLIASMMLPGIIFGVLLGTLPAHITAFFYAVTFGAIVYVVSDEIIPECHDHGYQRVATFSMIVGVLVVVLLQQLL